ncbi:hypothetical protein [Thermogymnomonas acidicola]|uniref:hypothetical protein n=1 Tax=Thermogymnomonas acidicola TaxID=399579 RepID=UPI0009462CB7|nr:hypothetical protein [Thermogymnomonas acidicola]
MELYLNSTVIDNESTVFFNYTVTHNGVSMSGSYDEVMFNSTGGMGVMPPMPTPAPYYLISGNTITPTGSCSTTPRS